MSGSGLLPFDSRLKQAQPRAPHVGPPHAAERGALSPETSEPAHILSVLTRQAWQPLARVVARRVLFNVGEGKPRALYSRRSLYMAGNIADMSHLTFFFSKQ